MGSFNFKSSGRTQEQRIIENLVQSPTAIGIKTPLQIGNNDFLDMHYNVADQMHDNLRNLLLTNWGERLGQYKFGANLRQLTSEFVNQDNFDSSAIENIRNAVGTWMPFIDLEDFISEVDRLENKNTGVIRITITYNIQSLNVIKRTLQVTLYVL